MTEFLFVLKWLAVIGVGLVGAACLAAFLYGMWKGAAKGGEEKGPGNGRSP